MSVYYRRLIDGYEYEKTETEITGKEVYLRDDNYPAGTVPLPTVGSTAMLDPDGATSSYCICRRAYAEYLASDSESIKWTFEFSTSKGKDNGKDVNTDTNARSFDLGGEVVQIDKPSNHWGWKNAAIKPVEQPLFKQLVVGSFTKFYGPYTTTQKDAFIGSLVSTYAGRVNSATFDGFAPGNVLFEGVRGGTVYDALGALKWQFEGRFAFRIVPGTGSLGWQYAWNANTGTWDIPTDSLSGSGNYLYDSVDFSSI